MTLLPDRTLELPRLPTLAVEVTARAVRSAPLPRNVLCDLGERNPASLRDDLVSTVRSRLLDAPR